MGRKERKEVKLKLCQGLGPSEVEECGVEGQEEVLLAKWGEMEEVQRENPPQEAPGGSGHVQL